MKQLGYFAYSEPTKTLYPFEWGADNTFYIIKEGVKTLAKADDYQILEIAVLIAGEIIP